jgi:hypothetical protein
MYKYAKIIALFATLAWLGFIFSAFKGFHFWYGGFVVFFWLALSALNYHHDTSLWVLKNRFYKFIKFYLFLVLFWFYADFILGQKAVGLWEYPFYHTAGDWFRLYLILYPFVGLTMIELLYFLSALFGEKLVIEYKKQSLLHKILDRLDLVLLSAILVAAIPAVVWPTPSFTSFFVWLGISWAGIATFKLKYHVRHWLHYLAIFTATFIMSAFLYELPNTNVFEWKYHAAPILNSSILQIPLWVIAGWYVQVLIMLKLWIYFVLKKRER